MTHLDGQMSGWNSEGKPRGCERVGGGAEDQGEGDDGGRDLHFDLGIMEAVVYAVWWYLMRLVQQLVNTARADVKVKKVKANVLM